MAMPMVFVSSLPTGASEEAVRSHFAACGTVHRVISARARDGSLGCILLFGSVRECEAAVSLDDSLWQRQQAIGVQFVCKFGAMCNLKSASHHDAYAHPVPVDSVAASAPADVDPLNSGDLLTKRVYSDKGIVYHAELRGGVMGRDSSDKFYRLQLIEDLVDRTFLVFSRWGRDDAARSNAASQTQTLTCDTAAQAIHVFQRKFRDKTGNAWPPVNFVPRPGKYTMVATPISASMPRLDGDDATVMRLVKKFVLAGGDVSGLHLAPGMGDARSSTLELLASPGRVPGLPVIDFLLKLGAPIVIVSGAVRHDAFLAMLRVPRLTKDSVVGAIAVLQRFLDAGYLIDSNVAARLVEAARNSSDAIHLWVVQRIAERGVKLVVHDRAFFEGDGDNTSPDHVLRELDIVDAPAIVYISLFEHLCSTVRHIWSKALFMRVLPLLPDAPARAAAALRVAERPDVLSELLKLVDPANWPLEQREQALWRVLSLRSPPTTLLAQVFERTGLSVNHKLSGATPLAHVVKRDRSLVLVVKWLLEQGADVNAADDADGNTPLHLSRDAELDALLVRAGADASARNKAGHTAFDLVDCSSSGDVERHWFFVRELPSIIAARDQSK